MFPLQELVFLHHIPLSILQCLSSNPLPNPLTLGTVEYNFRFCTVEVLNLDRIQIFPNPPPPRGCDFCQIPYFSPLIPTLSREGGGGVGAYIDSCIIHTVHLQLIYEAKIQVLSVFSWKPAQPRYIKTKSLLFLEA